MSWPRPPYLRHLAVNVADCVCLATIALLWIFGVSSLAFGLFVALSEWVK